MPLAPSWAGGCSVASLPVAGASACLDATAGFSVLLLLLQEQELFPCLWRQGVDDWEPYCQLYLDSVWERYVLPLGRPAGDKGGKGSKPQPAKQQGAPAAGAAAAALAGVAQRWAALWGKERPQEAAAKNAAAAAAAGRSLKRKGSPPRGQQPVSRSRRQVVPL